MADVQPEAGPTLAPFGSIERLENPRLQLSGYPPTVISNKDFDLAPGTQGREPHSTRRTPIEPVYHGVVNQMAIFKK